MNPSESDRERLLRVLDGKAGPADRERVAAWLRADPAARAFVREVAEQSVMLADLERSRQARTAPDPSAAPVVPRVVPARFRRWASGLAIAAGIVLLAATVQLLAGGRGWVGKVAWVFGSSQVFASRGRIENAPVPGLRLSPGDTLETRSCDAQLAVAFRDESGLVIIGNSTLRVLEDGPGETRLELQQGQLWASPPPHAPGRGMLLQTPTLSVQAREAQIYVQTTATETRVRVNRGTARVRQHLDQSVTDVPAGHEVVAALDRRAPVTAVPRPRAGREWACDLGNLPAVVLGRWLAPEPGGQTRLGTVPVLWPLPEGQSVLLHLAGVSVLSHSDRPILLGDGARLVFHGRTTRPQTVRFGFTTQTLAGAFSGKFELDACPSATGVPGEPWTLALPLADFRPLQSELAAHPEGLELTDVYALTIREDAGLELSRIELVAPTAGLPEARQADSPESPGGRGDGGRLASSKAVGPNRVAGP